MSEIAAKDADIVARHLRHLALEGKTARTIYERRRGLARLSAALPMPLIDATEQDLYDWRASLTKQQDATVATYVSNVRSFYSWAVKKAGLPKSPAADLPVPRLPRRNPHPMSEDDFAAALAAAHPLERTWLVLAGGGGLRCKEIALLRGENVRLRDAEPHILIAYDATKGRNERSIPVPEGSFLMDELRAARLPAAGWCWVRADGSPFPPQEVSRRVNLFLRRMAVSDTLHSLRHRFLTLAYEVNHDLRAAQELAGHVDVSTTAGYAAVSRSALAATVAAIPAPGRKAS